MLEKINILTNNYISAVQKNERKRYGQFFTSAETARFMAGLFDIPDSGDVSMLDAGAGSGILSCALLECLDSEPNIRSVSLTCYETDDKILGLLRENLEYCKKQMSKSLSYRIITDNYITSQYLEFNGIADIDPSSEKYDLVIGNPPYMKVSKNSPEATAMPEVCYGTPNLYFLFTAMGLFNLKEGGQMVYIIPRSWTSGVYFKRFRKYLLANGKLEHIHLFESRNKVFDSEGVLQETMIVKLQKTDTEPETVAVTSSVSNKDFTNISSVAVPYDLIVSGSEKYVCLATSDKDIKTLLCIHRFTHTLPDIGLCMKTGLTVDFRNYDKLCNTDTDGAVPLFCTQHISGGHICFPSGKGYEYILTDRASLMQPNENYLFIKRFTSKEEPRRLQSGVYLARDFPQYLRISTDNKINFIGGTVSAISEETAYGLYVLLNSTLYDSYYRILNGSTQVNSTEINAMPVPGLEVIQHMGRELVAMDDMSQECCDRILKEHYEKLEY